MKTVHIIDSSVYLVILNVPNFCTPTQLNETLSLLKQYNDSNDEMLLPLGTIIETGNHIADSVNGRRYRIAEKFINDVKSSLREETPYKLCGIPKGDSWQRNLEEWFNSFKDLFQNGIGMVDSICISIWQQMKEKFPNYRVRIWAYDKRHLAGYDTHPPKS